MGSGYRRIFVRLEYCASPLCPFEPLPSPRGVLKGRDFFFLLRTALKDRPKGPPTANRQLPSTANRHQPPTTNCQPPTASHQPPATNRRQLPAATNRQLPTTANCLQPPTASHQPPRTTTNRHQPPVANCQPPTANCHQPWLSTWNARGLFWETGTPFFFLFFFPLRTPLPSPKIEENECGATSPKAHALSPAAHGTCYPRPFKGKVFCSDVSRDQFRPPANRRRSPSDRCPLPPSAQGCRSKTPPSPGPCPFCWGPAARPPAATALPRRASSMAG